MTCYSSRLVSASPSRLGPRCTHSSVSRACSCIDIIGEASAVFSVRCLSFFIFTLFLFVFFEHFWNDHRFLRRREKTRFSRTLLIGAPPCGGLRWSRWSVEEGTETFMHAWGQKRKKRSCGRVKHGWNIHCAWRGAREEVDGRPSVMAVINSVQASRYGGNRLQLSLGVTSQW